MPCQQFHFFSHWHFSMISAYNKLYQALKAINLTTINITRISRNCVVIRSSICNFIINYPSLQSQQKCSISSKRCFRSSSLISSIYFCKFGNSLDAFVFSIKFINLIKPVKITNLMPRNFRIKPIFKHIRLMLYVRIIIAS